MVKTGVFKKIAALTAAVAMMASFALCASAASVQTTTQYTDSTKQEINVIANVSGLGGAVEVTYYATNGAKNVYIDQTTANADGEASFNYVTDTADLMRSSVSVGYTGAAATATDDDIPGYTISGEGITAITVPTEEINGSHVLSYTLASNKTFEGVTSDDATVSGASYNATDNTISVTLSDAEGNVVLNVQTDIAITHNPIVEFVDAALIVAGDAQDEVADEDAEKDYQAAAGNRKLSVLAKVEDATVFGILVSTEAITAGEADALPEGASYQALGANADNGYFAVQLIDTGDDGTDNTWLKSGVKYYTAVYYQHPDTEKYYIVSGNEVQIVVE